jgi:hypothetical protein
LSRRCQDTIGRPALPASGFDAGLALFDGDGFPLQCFFHQTFGLVAHRLLRHFALSRIPQAMSYMRSRASAMSFLGSVIGLVPSEFQIGDRYRGAFLAV